MVDGLNGSIDHLNAFREGLFQVQGESAQICSHLLLPRPGEKVLDVCAGLGGKSTHIAQFMCGKGEILALDMNHDRLLRLKENSHRLGMECIQSVVADAANPPLRMPGRPYDKILIDGPCSALGTISRHPDAKWFRNEQDIKRLSFLQREILNGTAPLLCKGGEILYVTCTVSKEENEEVVFDFLKKNRDMTLMDLREHVPEWGRALIDTQGFFRSLPHVHGMDGFFGALLTKDDR